MLRLLTFFAHLETPVNAIMKDLGVLSRILLEDLDLIATLAHAKQKMFYRFAGLSSVTHTTQKQVNCGSFPWMTKYFRRGSFLNQINQQICRNYAF